MKTTIDFDEPLFREAQEHARRSGVTFRTAVQDGLRLWLAHASQPKSFKLRDARVNGEGLHPEAQHLTPAEIIDFANGYSD